MIARILPPILFLGSLSAEGAAIYSNYTPGVPSTYDTGSPVPVVSSTALFDPTGLGVLIPGVLTDVLSVSFPVPDGLPNAATKFIIPIRIVNPGANSSISFSLYRGTGVYGAFTLNDEDFILDGQFHEYEFDTTFLPNGVFDVGGYRFEARLDHDPAATAEDVTMSVEFAGTTPADNTASATNSRFGLPTSSGVPAFFYGDPVAVPEPASIVLVMLGSLGLLRRKRD